MVIVIAVIICVFAVLVSADNADSLEVRRSYCLVSFSSESRIVNVSAS